MRLLVREVQRLLRIVGALGLALLGLLLLLLPGEGLEVLGMAREQLVKALPFLPRVFERVRSFWEWLAPKPEDPGPPSLRR